MWEKLLLGAFLAMTAVSAAGADDKPNEPYVRVEIRGTLATGIVVIGGETTGTVVRAGDIVWELDFGDDATLKQAAEKLNKQTVIVVGTLRKVAGVEVPPRHIVRVASLKKAE